MRLPNYGVNQPGAASSSWQAKKMAQLVDTSLIAKVSEAMKLLELSQEDVGKQLPSQLKQKQVSRWLRQKGCGVPTDQINAEMRQWLSEKESVGNE